MEKVMTHFLTEHLKSFWGRKAEIVFYFTEELGIDPEFCVEWESLEKNHGWRPKLSSASPPWVFKL